MSLSQIIEGWRNNILPPEELKDIIGIIGKARMEICEECEWHSKHHISVRPDDHCIQCGCTLSAKTKCLSCKCPLEVPKWDVVTPPK